MPKRAEHDFAVNAFKIVETAIGERMDGTPLNVPKEKPATANRGYARASVLSKERRVSIARDAAKKRWKKSSGSAQT